MDVTENTIESVSPTTGEIHATYRSHGGAELEARIAASHAAAAGWRKSTRRLRAGLLSRVAGRLREDKHELAELMAMEMGKPVAEGAAEAEKCAWVCDYYAEHGAKLLDRRSVDTDQDESFVCYQALGAILGVMPWNFPLWQVFRFAAPTLMAGNTVLLKHASDVPGCGLRIEAMFGDAGASPGVFTNLLIDSAAISSVIADPRVAAVSLTGSVPAGRAIAACAGEHLKKVVLELGGSDAYLILEDAELERAAELCAKSRLINSGQSCIAAKRFIVVDSVVEPFTALLAEKLQKAILGDPLRGETEVGPMARVDLRDALHDQVARSVAAGAELQIGGIVPDGPGAWYPVTLLSGVLPGMPAFDEELFGPVAAVTRARDEEHAIELANRHRYGLGAAVFTRDVDRGRRIAETELDAGVCCVNDFVKSDPRLPFGGVKQSGYGRELGEWGLREFLNIKSVSVSYPSEALAQPKR